MALVFTAKCSEYDEGKDIGNIYGHKYFIQVFLLMFFMIVVKNAYFYRIV